jgi:hypothetical protein
LRHSLKAALQLGQFSGCFTCAAGRANRHHECDQRKDRDEKNHAAKRFHWTAKDTALTKNGDPARPPFNE